MITWMQRHKKYLVITIWISVIAFVGAGFVGWGSVDFNLSRANYVAKVGRFGISHKEFDSQFARLFNIYNQAADGKLTQEEALKMGLDRQALGMLIQQKLLKNYAYDLGLRISDEMTVKEILKESAFADEKGFSKEKYAQILRENHIKQSEYEKNVKDSLLINNLRDIFGAYKASDEDAKMLASLLLAEDRVKIKIIEEKNYSPSLDELKAFYEENKENYKSLKTYKLAIFKLEPEQISDDEIKAYWQENKFLYKDEEGKILDYEQAVQKVSEDAKLAASNKAAKLAYVDLKSGKKEFSLTKTVDEKDELLSFVQDTPVGVVSKPFIYQGAWMVVKIESQTPAKVLDFEAAKDLLMADALEHYTAEKLNEKASKSLDDMSTAKDIGWLKLDKNQTNLDDEAYAKLVLAVQNGDKKGFVIDRNKAIVYEIIEQRLGENKELEKDLKSQLEQQAKMLIEDELIGYLGSKYKVEVFYEGQKL